MTMCESCGTSPLSIVNGVAIRATMQWRREPTSVLACALAASLRVVPWVKQTQLRRLDLLAIRLAARHQEDTMRVAMIVGAVLLTACTTGETGGSSGGSGGGGGGATATVTAQSSSSSSGASGTGGSAPVSCPMSPAPCYDFELTENSCVLVPSKAGTKCELNGHADMCNGYGVCSTILCDRTEDCGPPPHCFDVECKGDSTVPNACVFYVIKSEECGTVCGPTFVGHEVAVCKALNRTPFMCDRKEGPPLGPGVCSQPDAAADPLTWCCDL